MNRALSGLILILLIGGCTADGGKKKGGRLRNLNANATVEEAVRAAIAERCGKPPEQIDMGKPLSAPPLGMKRIDLADVIGTLEEEYRMAISDHAIEGRAGTGFEQAVTKLTPADLVFLVNTSKGNPPRKPMK